MPLFPSSSPRPPCGSLARRPGFDTKLFRPGALLASWLLAAAGLLPAAAGAQERPRLDVPFITTPPAVVQRILDFGEVGAGDFLIDLGSGDGRIPVTAAKERGARGFGVDIDPRRTREADDNARRAGVADRVSFRTQDLFETDLSQATVLTMYLFPEINMRLRPRLLSQLRPGTRIVSHAFHLEDWMPDRHELVDGNDVFLWRVPARVEGMWRFETPGRESFVLRLWQQFQRVQGVAMFMGERSVPIADASLQGTRLRFAVLTPDGRREFNGEVDGPAMRPHDGGTAWRAQRY